MKKKRWFITIAIVLCSLLVINIGISSYFYNLVIKRGPKDFLQGNADLEVSAETLDVFLEGDWIDWTQSRDFETMEMTSFAGLTLKGYYMEAEKSSTRTVVLANVYRCNAF